MCDYFRLTDNKLFIVRSFLNLCKNFDSQVPLDTTTNSVHLQHSTVDSHSDNLVISRSHLEHINQKLDHLTKRVQSLETILTTDVKTILMLLQTHHAPSSEVSTIKQEVGSCRNTLMHGNQILHHYTRIIFIGKPQFFTMMDNIIKMKMHLQN